ncbi:uracil-DNA glycosylase family protein [Sandarakinorhabdus glacialis]|uniref:uracil-DNA glycosylase family protein n=1 Tax=Sandarakinorhabdus glacialis TaxID=1614636 RepID=UPI00166AE755|nr:uracil-DNA glycosylase family protein [Polymorphobacter glacialis]
MSQVAAVDAASALAWLVAAGADAAVTDAPRNWLAAPPPRPDVPGPAPVAIAAMLGQPVAIPRADTSLSAIPDFAALEAALLAFDHPLRRIDIAPQLLTGNIASGTIILGDQPESPGTPQAALTGRMLAAIGLAPGDCARAHLLPWATPGERPPRDAEVSAFAPFRARALALAAPRLILAFGERAVSLSGEARGIASARGKWLAIDGIPMLAIFHPRQLLTQPELKRLAWADLQAFEARLKAQ